MKNYYRFSGATQKKVEGKCLRLQRELQRQHLYRRLRIRISQQISRFIPDDDNILLKPAMEATT